MSAPARLIAALADRYTIERELGQGGMATVYLAQDLKHDRQVAIKVLKPELAAVLGAERFIVEIKTTAALQHPHILPLFDSGAADGFLWYAMPFIDGETLRTKLDRETQLSVDEAVKLTTDVADALHYAHSKGIIHRDIKPENILLANGRPMVADFGIALAVSAAAGGRMTETGLSLGTPHYMSPEQATAEKEISNRSDIYSLASVCYEMLAGQPPHLGGSAQQIIMKIIAEPVELVTRYRKAVPANVAAALNKALEKLPADRFENAAKFAEALGNPHFTTMTAVATAGAGKGKRWQLVLGAGLLLGAVVGAIGMRALAPPSTSMVGLNREQLTFSGQAFRPAISPDGKRVAFVVSPCENGRRPGTDCSVSLQVIEVGGTRPQLLIPKAMSLGYPRWSHDGETLVVAGELDAGRAGLFAVSRLNATPQLLLARATAAYDTHAAGDSVMVVLQDSDTMLVIGLSDGTVHDRIALTTAGVNDLAWSHDGQRVAISTGGAMTVIGRHGAVQGSAEVQGRTWVRWSVADDALLYFRVGRAREDELVRHPVMRDGSLAAQSETILPRTPTLYEGQFDVARQTGTVVIGTGDAIQDVWSFDLTARPVEAVRETQGTTWYGAAAATGDTRLLYYYRGDALGDNVYQLDRVTGLEEPLTAQRLPGGNAMRLSPNESRMGYGHAGLNGAEIHVMELPSHRTSSTPANTQPRVVVPLDAGGMLALNLKEGALEVRDSLLGIPRQLTNPRDFDVGEFAVAPDGRSAVFVGRKGATSEVVLGRVALDGGAVVTLATLESSEFGGGVSVGNDGTVFLARWPVREPLPSIWSYRDGGRLQLLADIPQRCDMRSLVVNSSGSLAVCSVGDFRGDVWLFDLGKATR